MEKFLELAGSLLILLLGNGILFALIKSAFKGEVKEIIALELKEVKEDTKAMNKKVDSLDESFNRHTKDDIHNFYSIKESILDIKENWIKVKGL